MIEPIILNPSGTFEIIEFFDYNCGHCKRQYAVMEKLLKKHKNVKITLKPLNILGDSSLFAMQIGYAIWNLDKTKFLKFFDSIMNDMNYGGENTIVKAIKECKIDNKEVEKELTNNANNIEQIIISNGKDADKNGIDGTPAFIINDKKLVGEVELTKFENYLEDL